MPRLGSDEVDVRAVQLMHDWITSMNSENSSRHTNGVPADEDPAMAQLLADAASVEGQTQLQVAMATTRGALQMMKRLERGGLPPAIHQAVLAHAMAHPQMEIRDLFERFVPADQRQARLGVRVNVDELLAIAGDANQGREIFFRDGAATCKNCHRVADQGSILGPDLSQIGKKYPPRELLVHILEPSRTIDPAYTQYLLETTEGRIISGLLLERTAQDITLKNPQLEVIKVSTDQVDTLAPQPLSLMPDQLLRDLSPQQAADLLAYLSSLK